MVVKESKSFLFDRDYRSATTRRRMSNLASDFIIGGSIMRMTNQSSAIQEPSRNSSPDTMALKKQETVDA